VEFVCSRHLSAFIPGICITIEKEGTFLKNSFLLMSKTAVKLYTCVKALPIYDYHCHLSAEEIYKDEPFENIGKLWLEHDHYKWRLMRSFGIDEERITGGADWREKFLAFSQAIAYAAGNPLYHWTAMELSAYFGIDLPLNPENAELIWNTANSIIKARKLSPKKLIRQSNVKYIATTNDVTDSLEFHTTLRYDDYVVTVAPAFRTDRLLLITEKEYPAYIIKLSALTEMEIKDLSSLQAAVAKRLDFFKRLNCRFSDVGIPYFPDSVADFKEADRIFRAALERKEITEREFLAFLGYMFVFLGNLYRENNIVMQWHLAAARNVNSRLFAEKGADSGGDCIGEPIPTRDVLRILDAINNCGGLPKTILYSLHPAMLEPLAVAAGCFENVFIGPAWWFNDHVLGITQTLETVAHSGLIAAFPGMVTDSRSFLSYVRHDYFRRILCSLVGNWVESGEFCGDAEQLCVKICCGNAKELIEGT